MSELTNNTFKKHLGLLHNRLNEISTPHKNNGAELSTDYVLEYLKDLTEKIMGEDSNRIEWTDMETEEYRTVYSCSVEYPRSARSYKIFHIVQPSRQPGGSSIKDSSLWKFITADPHRRLVKVGTLDEIGKLVTEVLTHVSFDSFES